MTYGEEVHWWDAHDISDYKDEFKVGEPFEIEPGALRTSKHLIALSRRLVAENKRSALNIRLTKRDHIKLKIAARRKGIGISTLVRMWILENLKPSGRPQHQKT